MPGLTVLRRNIARARVASSFVGASTQYATVADNAAISMGVGPTGLTLTCWFRMNDVSTLRILFGKGSFTAAGTHEYGLNYQSSSSRVDFRLSNGASIVTVQAPVNTVQANRWHFATGTWDGSTMRVMVDMGTAVTGSLSGNIRDGTDPLRIGANSGGSFPMTGLIEGVRGWKRKLADEELHYLYNGGQGRAYRELSLTTKDQMMFAYGLDGNWNDNHGTSHMAPINGASFGVGWT